MPCRRLVCLVLVFVSLSFSLSLSLRSFVSSFAGLQVLHRILNNENTVMSRMRLEFCVVPDADADNPQVDKKWSPLLNEVVLKRAARLTGVAAVDCWVDGTHLARIQGDGLMVATPTGSTAYSLATGGSIVHPELDVMLFSPINPMTLSSRPLVLPGSSVIKFKNKEDACYVEGKFGRAVQLGEVVMVRKCKYPIMCFARDNPASDWMHDLGARLSYERQVRPLYPPPLSRISHLMASRFLLGATLIARQ